MGHPELQNGSGLAFEPAFLADEEGRPLFVPIVKGTWRIVDGARLELAEEQVPVNLAGEYWGNPDTTSYKYEPECVFFKPATDVALIGHAYPAERGATEVAVGLRVGPVQKVVRVVGDRFWVKGANGRPTMTPPRPFERIALRYECAFGGWDRNDPDPNRHSFEPRNPLGIGFRLRWWDTEQAVRLPSLEDPQRPIKSLSDRPPPAGFGFTSPNWQPRAAFAGTYDAAWMKTRMPLLPKDFDRRFFNAASPGLIAPGHLKGDEPVIVVNASPRGRIAFHLPRVAAPEIGVELRGRRHETLPTLLDTVIVNTDEDLVILVWRAHLAVRNVPQDVAAITLVAHGLPQVPQAS